jgi:hypothetical protein
MLSRIHANRIIKLGCALAPALLVSMGDGHTQTIEFQGTIVKPTQDSTPAWPFAIVSFASAAILPISELCVADCKTMTIENENGAGEPFKVVTVNGVRAAIVALPRQRQQFTVCDRGRGSCMRYTVLRGK